MSSADPIDLTTPPASPVRVDPTDEVEVVAKSEWDSASKRPGKRRKTSSPAQVAVADDSDDEPVVVDEPTATQQNAEPTGGAAGPSEAADTAEEDEDVTFVGRTGDLALAE